MRIISPALAALAISSAAAQAQTLPSPAVQQELIGKCKGDYDKLCANVTPGGGRIIACFQKHAAELSPSCKSALLAQKKP